MGFINDFKAFVMRGNVVDMAVGVIIGGAFGKIISSLVADVIMPPIGMLLGGVNFNELVITLQHATPDAAAVTINYGTFVQAVLDFLIIALAIFSAIRMLSKLHKKAADAPAPPTQDQQLLAEIRDLLKQKK